LIVGVAGALLLVVPAALMRNPAFTRKPSAT
jgi:hypothetical protein